jgi:hypothetical protein
MILSIHAPLARSDLNSNLTVTTTSQLSIHAPLARSDSKTITNMTELSH